ncbi:DUF3570 domain-containing protein [Aureisphaera galaxeae]|uniref:DUF3570 domain-containing protein n=1 Tax=Aureisphaera galaxeae TaxID=1538023 RepID=UPI00234FFF99|nr:DUF3570 domain-containing protein [Aureisphaera galaxeae]MDC8004574.1 DUF3570 domain-containing protein [Aureisphaera galaxeae]
MKNILTAILSLSCICLYAQDNSNSTYQKRVLENAEIDFVSSYYEQDGNNASVTGGIGTERLTDVTPTITITMPLSANEILTVDAGISAYTSASSSNLDPFDSSGASGGEYDDDLQGGNANRNNANNPVTGSPWVASSGESYMDIWGNATLSYTKYSEDRNRIWNVNGGISAEYDYFSAGFGGGYTWLFNQKNTEIGVKGSVFLDKWSARYPTELDSYLDADRNLNNGFFEGIDILNEQGQIIDKNGNDLWSPVSGFELIQNKNRNSYTLSLSFSQILSRNAQLSLFVDLIQQEGWLANPMQRVYFGDRPNYFVGNAANIPNYTSQSNTDVFQLADDFERLPDTRFKTPIGARLNYFINEYLTVRTYYRYYFDNWGMSAHTASVELPIKLGDKFTLYPNYRYYTQSAIDYFAPFEEHLSTQQYYTSDFDLSSFNAHQYGFGIRYTDIFTKFKLFKFGLKSIDLRFAQYERSTGLNASIISGGFKFIFD